MLSLQTARSVTAPLPMTLLTVASAEKVGSSSSCAAGIRPLLKVFGNDYPTPDGTPVRDYIHVCDLAEAHVKAMEYMQENGFEGMDCFNLGTGRGYSVLEVIGSFERVTGIKLAYEIAGRRDGDIAQIWADAGKAERLLGWKARRTLDEMTLSAWKWQENLQKKI